MGGSHDDSFLARISRESKLVCENNNSKHVLDLSMISFMLLNARDTFTVALTLTRRQDMKTLPGD